MAAGGIHTPQILQLSGIGDGPLLDKLGIETVAHVPGIGTNLQDHLYALAVFSCKSLAWRFACMRLKSPYSRIPPSPSTT